MTNVAGLGQVPVTSTSGNNWHVGVVGRTSPRLSLPPQASVGAGLNINMSSFGMNVGVNMGMLRGPLPGPSRMKFLTANALRARSEAAPAPEGTSPIQ